MQVAIVSDYQVAELLINKGANIKNADGETLLRGALLGGRLDIVQLLEKHGADVDAEIQKDPSLIRQVATNGSPLVADYLISRGADTSHISVAAYLGKLDRVKAYIESGSQQISETDKDQILLGAITGGHANIVEYILEHEADIRGITPEEMVQYLIGSWAKDYAPRSILLGMPQFSMQKAEPTAYDRITRFLIKKQIDDLKCENCTFPLGMESFEEGKCKNCGTPIEEEK